MRTKLFLLFTVTSTLLFPHYTQAMVGAHGEYAVGVGPMTLGTMIMTSDCDQEMCHYETKIKGSFMFIGADIKEQGTYKHTAKEVIPITAQYSEKIGSKKKSFNYNFLTKIIEDRKTNKQKELPVNSYTFISLVNQVILDLHAGGPRESYTYLSKKKIKHAITSNYTKSPTEKGTLHSFIGKEDDEELAFFFIENNDEIELERINFGNFHLLKK